MNSARTISSPHRHAIGATALLTLGIVWIVVGDAWAGWLECMIRDGGVTAAWFIACIGLGRLLIPRRLFERSDVLPDANERPKRDSGALVLATSFAAGAGLLSLVVLGSGLTGVLGRPVAWGMMAIGWVVLLLPYCREKGRTIAGRLTIGLSPWSWLWLTAAPALAVMLVAPAVLPGVLWGDEPNGYDVVAYHLQVPREWYDAGRITRLPHNVFSIFPFMMEMHYLLSMHLTGGPYAGMYVSQYMHAAFAVFTSIAVYGLLGGRARPQAVFGGLITLVVPWTGLVGTVAYNEAAMMLCGVLCVGWGWRAIEARREETDRANVQANPNSLPRSSYSTWASCLAGVMGGLACGVKLTAIPMLVGSTAIAMLIVSRKAVVVRQVILLLMTAVLVSSPWWIKSFAWTGNPVFPQATSVFGGRDWSAVQAERWSVAHSPREDQRSIGGRVMAFKKQVLADWRFGFALFPATALAFLVPTRDGRGKFMLFGATVLVVQVVCWIALTHLQGRFLALSVPVCALIIGAAAGPGWRAIVPTLAVLGCLAAGTFHPAVASDDDPTMQPLPTAPLARLMDPRTRMVIGLRDPEALWNLHAKEIADAVTGTDRPIALVGDAKAFWWPVASKRLFYRSVFDVDARDGETMIDAWLRSAPADAIVVIEPNELRRLTRTYRGLGAVPPEVEGHEMPYIREKPR